MSAARMQLVAVDRDGTRSVVERPIAQEVPVAVELNGIGYAVLMATGTDLEDLGLGFALTERLIDDPGQLRDVGAHRTPDGIMLRLTIAEECVPRIQERVRHRSSESSCGLCGIENLEQAMRPLPRLPAATIVRDAAIFRALDDLRGRQPLNRETGGVHAAALCGHDGDIRVVREDVGRHNAFDKLIGAMARLGQAWDGGFALLSSRCSYELVEKAVLSTCPTLVTVSVPTSLALARAAEAGLDLVVLARPDRILRMVVASE